MAVTGSHARFAVGVHGSYKVKRAGSLATHLWMRAIVYANGQPRLDGRIPVDVLPDLVPDVARGDIGERGGDGIWRALTPRDVLHRAINAGLFDPITSDATLGDVVPIHDYLDWNGSGAERHAASATKAAAARLRHTKATPTDRDPGTGRFSSSRAKVAKVHGPIRAPRTVSPVPTSAAATAVPAATATSEPEDGVPSSTATLDGDWMGYGAEWDPVRHAMAERGYRLPPVGGRDVAGTQRHLVMALIRADSAKSVAGRMRRAPGDLRAPARPFRDLVGWLLEEARGRDAAVATEPMTPRIVERGTGHPVRAGDVVAGMVDGPAASAAVGL